MMIKMLKSGLLWQLTAGFAIGTVGMFAMQPANAGSLAHPAPIVASAAR